MAARKPSKVNRKYKTRYRVPLRQTEGFVWCLLRLMGRSASCDSGAFEFGSFQFDFRVAVDAVG